MAVVAPVASADDLAAIGARAAAAAARVAPAVVAVQSPSTVPPDGSLWQTGASGVLIVRPGWSFRSGTSRTSARTRNGA